MRRAKRGCFGQPIHPWSDASPHAERTGGGDVDFRPDGICRDLAGAGLQQIGLTDEIGDKTGFGIYDSAAVSVDGRFRRS